MGPKEVKTGGAGVREEEQPLLGEPAKGWGRHTCRFFSFPQLPSLASVSPWLNPARSHCHRRLGNTACKGQLPRGRFQERDRAGEGWRMLVNRTLRLSLYYFASLVNEQLESRELIHLCGTRVHHVFSDCGRLFTALPVEDFIFPPTAKWLAVPPCGRNISPLSINIRFHRVTCFGQCMRAYQVPTEALRVFVWLRHLRLDRSAH